MADRSEYTNKYFWYIVGDRIALVEKKAEGAEEGTGSFTSITTAGIKIRLEYVTRPKKFTGTLTESSEIPEQFHEALAMKVIADMYKLPGENFNLQVAQYFDQQYAQEIREAKKYASRHHVRGGQIRPVEF